MSTTASAVSAATTNPASFTATSSSAASTPASSVLYPTETTVIPISIKSQDDLSLTDIVAATEQLDKRSIAEKAHEALLEKKYTKEDIQLLTAKAEQGEKEAQYELGQYLYKEGQKHDPTFLKINVATNSEERSSQIKIAVSYLEPALKWLHAAAKQHVTGAQYILAEYLRTDPRIKSTEENRKDMLQAMRWYTRAANNGHDLAQFNMGRIYHCGASEGIARNPKTAYQCFLAAAKQGNCHAQYQLGLYYLFGIGISQNEKKAFYWLTRSMGATRANDLINLFAEHISPDIKKTFAAEALEEPRSGKESFDAPAIELADKRSKASKLEDYLRKKIVEEFTTGKIAILAELAKQDYSYPAFKLGFYYYLKMEAIIHTLNQNELEASRTAANNSNDSKQDKELSEQFLSYMSKGVPLLKQAANDNIAAAQYALAQIYLAQANSINNDTSHKAAYLNQAYQWFDKAASLGDDRAQFMLAEAYNYGLANPALKVDKKRAQLLYLAAAKQGHSAAQARVAYLYLNESYADLAASRSLLFGTNVPLAAKAAENKQKGIYWLKTSAGNAEAQKALQWYEAQNARFCVIL